MGANSDIQDEQQALNYLLQEAEDITPFLESGFGGRKALFISLWRSSLRSECNEPGNLDYLDDMEILSQRLATGEFAAQVFMV